MKPEAGSIDPYELRRISVGSDAFACLDRGSGPSALFLHGALGDLRTWLPHVALLWARFRCIAYTQRFFGTQPWRDDGPAFGVATHADDLIAVVEALGAAPVRVVAWSYGGHAALHATLRRPDLFAGLFLYEPGVRTLALPPEEQSAFDQDARAAFGPVFERVGAGDLEGAVRVLIDSSGGPGTYDAQPIARRVVHSENAHTMPLLLGQEPPPATTCDELGRLGVPTKVLWGEHSRPFSKLPAQAVARCIGSDGHAEVSGVGHLWPEEDAEGFTATVERWMTAR